MVAFDYSVPGSWYDGCYIDKGSTVKASRSFSLRNGNRRACLMLHGYQGYPGELVRPAVDLFEKGFDVYVPRLPGHGTSGDDFASSGWEDWVRLSLNAARDLSGRYGSFSILGHSMGTALALIASSETHPERVVLAAPAIPSGMGMPGSDEILSIFGDAARIRKEWHPNREYRMYYEDAPADDEYLGAEYWSWVYPKGLQGLMKVLEKAEGLLPLIECPILSIACEKDEVAGPGCAIAAAGKARNGMLKSIGNATHFCFYDKDKKAEQEAVDAVLDFLVPEIV